MLNNGSPNKLIKYSQYASQQYEIYIEWNRHYVHKMWDTKQQNIGIEIDWI